MGEIHWFEDKVPFDPILKEQGFTYLMLACSQENYPFALRLINEGTDVNAVSRLGETALLQAVRYAYQDIDAALKIVCLLLKSGADINAQTEIERETALMRATYHGYIKIVRILLDNRADVNLRRADGNTVLSSIEAAPSVVQRRRRIIRMLEAAGGIR